MVEVIYSRTNKIDGSLEFTLTADGSGAFTSQAINKITGNLASAAIMFDATTPPNALSITITDADGIDLLGGAGASITATKRVTNSPPQIFDNGLNIIPTGNTTAGAIIAIKLYFI